MKKIVLSLIFFNLLVFNLFSETTIEEYEKLLSAKYNVYKHFLLYGTEQERDAAFLEFKNVVEKYKSIQQAKIQEEQSKIQVMSETATSYKTKYGRVEVSSALNFRTGPGTSNSIITSLYNGQALKIVGEQNGWYNVEVNGKKGWVSGKYVKIVPDAPAIDNSSTTASSNSSNNSSTSTTTTSNKKAYVNASGLNFRTSASLGASVIKVLPRGKELQVLGTSGSWTKIQVDGKIGYVSSNYISTASTSTYGSSSSSTNSRNVSSSGKNSGDHVIAGVPLRNQAVDAVYKGVNYASSWCGPTSVGMVMDYYGINKTQSTLAVDCKYTFRERSGTPTSGMVSAAKKYGFANSKETWSSSMDYLREEIYANRPVIVLVDTKWKGHYIVVTGFRNGKVIVNDPAGGKTSEYSESYFYNMWNSRGRRTVTIKK
jgi:uncharacterized protein YgiM (DUF1202 family)